MDLEPHLIKKQLSEFDSQGLNKESDQILSEDEDPYSFTSTTTSLIGLAIVFVMLVIPLIAVLNARPATRKSIIPSSINKNGSEPSPSFSISWVSKSSS